MYILHFRDYVVFLHLCPSEPLTVILTYARRVHESLKFTKAQGKPNSTVILQSQVDSRVRKQNVCNSKDNLN